MYQTIFVHTFQGQMFSNHTQEISRFWVAGINYKKSDAAVRGQFAINEEQYSRVLDLAKSVGLQEVFVLSTCNRTEIYGLTPEVSILVDILCSETQGDAETFYKLAYFKQGHAAINHLFEVGAGLDSQILGDYEIVGQIKNAVKFSRQQNCIGGFIERLVNGVLQASKNVKNQTALSGGTVSVSFAAVQFIRENEANVASKNILLIGVGKIGRNTCKNLVDYLGTTNITLLNRTTEKAAELAKELGIRYAPYAEISGEIRKADIILVATNSTEPVVLRSDLENFEPKLIIDLSIPYNVEQSAWDLPGIRLVNVDELSKLKDETLQKREAEVPHAKSIIREHMDEFLEWHDHRKHVPVLKAVKLKLQEIHLDPIYISSVLCSNTTAPAVDVDRIQKVINGMAIKMRSHNTRGCHYIQAINEFMGATAN